MLRNTSRESRFSVAGIFILMTCLAAIFTFVSPTSGLSPTNFQVHGQLSIANPGLVWSPPIKVIQNGGGIISCPSTTWCMVADSQGNQVIFQNGSWGAPVNFDPYPIVGLSCASPSFCGAIDLANQVMTFNGTTWTKPDVIDTNSLDVLTSISCTDSNQTPFCALTDSQESTPYNSETGSVSMLSSNSWSTPTEIDSSGSLNSISCSAPTSCVAVDDQGNAFTYSGTWGNPVSIDPGNSLTSVSCPSGSSCVAVDVNGNATTMSANTWSKPTRAIHDGIALSSISCPNVSFCGAVGTSLHDTGNVALDNLGTWTVQHAELGQDLDSISCPSTQVCFGLDGLGQVVTGSNGIAGSNFGFYELTSSGEVYSFGSVASFGEPSTAGPAKSTWMAIAPTDDDLGYWAVTSTGYVQAFGDAQNFTSGQKSSGTIVSIAGTGDSGGYWLASSSGAVFASGDAVNYGSLAQLGIVPKAPIVALVPGPNSSGYWLVASDGGVFAFGDAQFYGSMAGISINAPVVGALSGPNGHGYLLVGSDGGAYAFGSARYYGSSYSASLINSTSQLTPLNLITNPVVGVLTSTSGQGYLMVTSQGVTLGFGDAFPSGISAGNEVPVSTIASVAGFS